MNTPQSAFDPTATLALVQAQRAAAKRRTTWGKSRLVPHRAELVKLRQAGGSFVDLQQWLRKQKRVKVDSSTVRRFLQQLPELEKSGG